MKLEQIQQSIPAPLYAGLNWTAAVTGLAAFLTTWVPIIVGILSGVWIALQIFLAWPRIKSEFKRRFL